MRMTREVVIFFVLFTSPLFRFPLFRFVPTAQQSKARASSAAAAAAARRKRSRLVFAQTHKQFGYTWYTIIDVKYVHRRVFRTNEFLDNEGGGGVDRQNSNVLVLGAVLCLEQRY